MINNRIFAQYQPAPNEYHNLYVVETGKSAFGTVYISAHNGNDNVSIMLVPSGEPLQAKHYILYKVPIVGNVPVYIQQLYLNDGDTIVIHSMSGDCSFTFTGELYG